MNASYIVVLGSTESLALAELSAFFPSIIPLKLSDSAILFRNAAFDPKDIQKIAGGVVKIGEVVSEVDEIHPQILADILLSRNKDASTIVFGISRFDGKPVSTELLHEVKDVIERQGKHCRYVISKSGELSSVVIQKQGVHEILITKGDAGFVIGITLMVQDFESWGKRDYGRPFADPKSGMLPPKVARMAVNLGIGLEGTGKTILDPFCGMGTVLAEGLMRGCRVIGGDVSNQVVEKAQKNLDWLVTQYPTMTPDLYKVFVSDATHISNYLPADSIDAIITEPFMGTAALGEKRITDGEKIRGIVKGLEKLYIGALRDWTRVLKSSGKVVIALPKYDVQGRTYFVKKVVDNCENFGYTSIVGPIEYSRPQAVVKREFFVFKKHS